MKPPLPGPEWGDSSFWLLRFTADQLHEDFIPPLIGNGLFATRIGELAAVSSSSSPLLSLSKIVFDQGVQRALPEWARARIAVDGCDYSLAAGRHDLTHTLDLRTGEVELRDRWEYQPGYVVEIAINLVILRSHRHGATLRIAVRPEESTGKAPSVQIAIGLNGSHVAGDYRMRFEQPGGDMLLGRYETTGQRRPVCQGLHWQVTGGAAAATIGPASATLNAIASGPVSLDVFHAFHTYADGPGEAGRVLADLRQLASIPRHRLESENLALWKDIWRRALALPEGNPEQKRQLLINQFNLLTSLDEGVYPLGACGLGALAWGGHSLWDADLWMFRAILPLWPEMARAILDFRIKGLEAARANAKASGLDGAWFPWRTGESGECLTKPEYKREIHTGIWIALGCREYHRATGDDAFISDKAWPMISAIAEFYSSWAVRDASGQWHLNSVIGPDEAVTEVGPGSCDDHFLINLGVRRVLGYASELASHLGRAVPTRWGEVEQNLVLMRPGADGVIPQHNNYRGEETKQADVILAICLLGAEASAQQVLANVDYYRKRTWLGGPLMTSQIEAWLLMRHGDKTYGIRHLFDEYAPFVRGLHRLTFECRPRENQNYNFLTAISGQLLALIFGYYDYQTGRSRTFPQLGDFWQDLPDRYGEATRT